MKTKTRAFTLVEIIVSLAIFSIVAVVALGALVKIISANNKAQTLQSAMTNLNYAIESISREMRVGKNYYCGTAFTYDDIASPVACGGIVGSDELSSDAYIAFESSRKDENNPCSHNLLTAYRFSMSDGIGKWRQQACDDFPGGDFSSVIDDEITLDGYFIRVDTTSGVPLATIRISGYSGTREREKTYFDVQTSISPRIGGDE